MDIELPNLQIQRRFPSAPKARMGRARKPAQFRAFSAPSGGKHSPPHFPPQRGPILREPGALSLAPGFGRPRSELPLELGRPLSIREVAALIGCSPWTVRQTLIPRGLPFFRSGASGKFIFYRDEVTRWVKKAQGGN